MKKRKNEKTYQKYYNIKISVKIAIIFLFLICIFFGILFWKFYYNRYEETLEYTHTISTQTLNTVKKNIVTLVENIAYDSRLILSSGDITEALQECDVAKQKESLYQFISLIDFDTYINGIYIADMDQNVCSIDRNYIRTFRTEDLEEIGWYDEVINLQGFYCLKTNADRVLTKSNAQQAVSLIRAVIDPDCFEPIGIMMLNIDASAFEDCYSNIQEEDVPVLYILDETGKIVASRSTIKMPRVQEILSRATEDGVIAEENGERILFEKIEIEHNGWKILTGVNVRNKFSFMETIDSFWFFTFELLVVFGVISYLVMHYFVTVPLRRVIDFMNCMNGRQFRKIDSIRKGEQTYYELEVLKNTYNHMVDEIDLLVERVYEEERIKRKTELNILQEQMKPHFLYNTIDAMSYLALTAQNDKLYDALEAFGGYYRTLLSKGKELIQIEKEMEMVKDYLELQKLRYGEMLEYELILDEKLHGAYVLKMILQPFVENSVNHGIREKEDGGKVWVKGSLRNDYMQFMIIDDGVGIADEIIKNLHNEKIDRNQKSFGMRGTIERMKIFYNDDIEYAIESEIGKGTQVTIKVPVLKQDGER